MKACWVLLATIVGCAGDAPVEDEAVDENVEEEIVPVDLTMPEYPAAEAGRVVVQSVSQAPENRFVGNWPAEAGRCQGPTVVQIVARDDSAGVIVFIGPSDSVVGEYDVYAGRSDVPDTLTARVALQVYGSRSRLRGLRGVGGAVEVQRADSIVTGRLAVQLIDDRSQDTVLMAASFHAPLRNVPESWCRVFGPRSGGGSVPVRASPQRR